MRFNGFSLLYGCLLLVSSLLPKPTAVTLRGKINNVNEITNFCVNETNKSHN